MDVWLLAEGAVEVNTYWFAEVEDGVDERRCNRREGEAIGDCEGSSEAQVWQ